MAEDLTRRGVRHLIVRRRNERIAQLRDGALPVRLVMHPATHEELLVDDDPAEQMTIGLDGTDFMGIPILVDERLPVGELQIQWPVSAPARDAQEATT